MNSTGNKETSVLDVNPDISANNSKPGISFVGENTVLINSNFGDSMTNPSAMNQLRQDLRAWFMAYLPNWEHSPSNPNSLEESIEHYELIDEFISGLIAKGIQKGGVNYE